MDRASFYKHLRRRDSGVFGTSLSTRQVAGMEGILNAFIEVGDGMPDTLAYALATAYHEVGGRMVPVREGFAKTDEGARLAVRNLAKKRGPQSAVARYSQPQPPYGHVYYGRGLVQLTWLKGYAESSKDAGVDLVKNPDAMLDPEISARLLFKGLLDGRWNARGKGLRYYLDRGDMRNARRTVNITDEWQKIAGYHRAFLAAINAAGGAPKPTPLTAPKDEPKSFIFALFKALFGGKS